MNLIVRPNGKKSQYQSLEPFSAIEMPFWGLMLANSLGGDVQILDAEAEGLSLTETFERIIQLKPDKIHIMPIGSHPSANIQQLDIAKNLYALLNEVMSVRIHTKLDFNPIECGLPDYSLLNVNRYRAHNWHSWSSKSRTPYASTFTSISCPYSCNFCQIKSFYGSGYKVRAIDSIECDIKRLYEKHGVVNIKLMDELFAVRETRISELSQKLSDIASFLNIWAYARIDTVTPEMLKNMYKMGVKWLAYGIEHGLPEMRAKINKGNFTNQKIKDVIQMTKDAGINALGNFMFGFEDDDLDTMRATLDFAKELQCEYANFYCVVCYPDSPLHDDLVKNGKEYLLPTSSEGYAQMSKQFKPMPTKYVGWKEVVKFRDQAFNEYFNDQDYTSMMRTKFGDRVVEDIADMVAVPIEREFQYE